MMFYTRVYLTQIYLVSCIVCKCFLKVNTKLLSVLHSRRWNNLQCLQKPHCRTCISKTWVSHIQRQEVQTLPLIGLKLTRISVNAWYIFISMNCPIICDYKIHFVEAVFNLETLSKGSVVKQECVEEILTSLTVSSGRSNEIIACKCLRWVSEAWPPCLGPSREGAVSSCNPSLSSSSTRSTAPPTRAKLSLVCGNKTFISYAFLEETLYTHAWLKLYHKQSPFLKYSSSWNRLFLRNKKWITIVWIRSYGTL